MLKFSCKQADWIPPGAAPSGKEGPSLPVPRAAARSPCTKLCIAAASGAAATCEVAPGGVGRSAMAHRMRGRQARVTAGERLVRESRRGCACALQRWWELTVRCDKGSNMMRVLAWGEVG